jgi:hypothetical protein
VSGVLSQVGWRLGATAIVLGAAWLAQRVGPGVGRYYQEPDEPTLLDAPHAADQARQAERDAEAEGGAPWVS